MTRGPTATSLPGPIPPRKMHVLLSAYACEPGRGSEPAVGWNVAMAASTFSSVWVLTRANNRERIEAVPESGRIHWVYYDLPGVVRSLKKRFGLVYPYYLLWQLGARKHLRRIVREERIDVIHHVTFGTAFLPTLAAVGCTPVVWGPIGGLMSTPCAFRSFFGLRARLSERLRDVGVLVARRLLLLLVAKSVRCVLAVSDVTLTKLPRRLRKCAHVCSQVGIAEDEWKRLAASLRPVPSAGFSVIMAGRLVHWKGFALGIAAFARFAKGKQDVRLDIVGSGHEEGALRRQCARLGIGNNVVFHGMLDRVAYGRELAASDVCLFPSLHEPGAFVIVEAMAAGKPVVCFDAGEPATEVTDESGFRIPMTTSEAALRGFADALETLYRDAPLRNAMGLAAQRRAAAFIWDKRLVSLEAFYSAAAEASAFGKRLCQTPRGARIGNSTRPDVPSR